MATGSKRDAVGRFRSGNPRSTLDDSFLSQAFDFLAIQVVGFGLRLETAKRALAGPADALRVAQEPCHGTNIQQDTCPYCRGDPIPIAQKDTHDFIVQFPQGSSSISTPNIPPVLPLRPP
jgi:hypothetical protein